MGGTRVGKIAVSAIAFVLFASASVTVRAADKLTVGKAAQTSTAVMPIDVGVKAGVFAAHGLDVEVVNFAGSAKMHQAMLAGSVDIGIGGGPEMALVAKGAPERAICDEVPSPAFVGLAIAADSPIHAIADLKGKKIAVASIGGLTYWLALELARREAWSDGSINIVEIGNEPSSNVAMLRTHAVDASYTATALAFAMEEQGIGKLLETASRYEGNVAAGVIFATQHIIASNPDAVRRFLAGWLDTIAYMRGHKDETVAVERGITGFSPAVEAKEYDLTIDMFSRDCRFDAQSLEDLQRSFADLKLTAGAVHMKDLYTEDYLVKP
jgi:NitT/TauT family transport system substrate-binding protein